MRLIWGLGLLWAQSVRFDPYLPQLPPPVVKVLEGEYRLKEVSEPPTRDSTGDFSQWIKDIPWEPQQEWYPAEWVGLDEPLYIQGRPVQYLLQYRWQIHRSGRRLRFCTELPRYQIEPVSTQSSLRRSSALFASQSVLANGTWYKIATGEGGIYQITTQTLQALGIDPSSVDPRQLRLYGQVGGPLPQENNAVQPDDLVEIPLFFPGESDGRWDPQDVAYFWAESPHAWYPLRNANRPYFHLRNPYTDSCYYFLTFDQGVGARISAASVPSGTPSPRSQVMTFFFHERELTNLVKSGRVWLGESFSALSPTLSLTLPLPACDTLWLRIQLANASFSPSSFTVRLGNSTLGTVPISAIPGPADNRQAQWGEMSRVLLSTPASPTLTVTYSGTQQGYLDYVEAIGIHPLSYQSGQSIFYVPTGTLWQVIGQGNLPPFLWDVTNGTQPQLVSVTATAGGFSFLSPGDTLRRYCAFDLNSAYAVRPIGRVANQNLHALHGIRFIVATTSVHASVAQRFCELHPEAGPCVVVTAEALYNEFSGGRPDICALRNFLRMLYVRATSAEERPRYLLIVGAASYNFREPNPNFFPTYQSRESFYPPATYGSDDFFGFLDDNEGFWGEGAQAAWYDPRDRMLQSHGLDLCITRLPIQSASDLEAYLSKLSNYLRDPATRGDWLQKIVLFSDYKDGGEHTRQAEQIAQTVQQNLPYLDQVKLYIDRYPAQPRASGLVFPQAQTALLAQLNSGAFIAHYVGHGNEYTLQGFEFFPLTAVRQLQNVKRYLFFVTATCEWGKWDDPQIRSGGLEALFLPERGAIGLLTSTRKVFSTLNFALSLNFYADLYDNVQAQRPVYLGELMMGTKNRSWGGGMAINTRSFAFLGDPLLPMGVPDYRVVLTRVGSRAPDALQPDTLRPLRAVQVEGEIQDGTGRLIEDFSGEVTLRVWDKPVIRQTLISQTTFTSQDILLFSGKATVQQGRFRLTFYLPIDLLPEAGYGRISAWAQASDGRTAAGAESRFVVCCPDTGLSTLSSPKVKVFINDTTWISGGWTHPNPLLIGFFSDTLGINLSSLAVGRELKAILNGQEYFLSEYYRAQPDKPNQGKVEYRFSNLPEGEYRLQLRAYNLAGQEGSAETTFIVAEVGKLKLGRVFNYPNPFTTHTRFFFEHNQPGQSLEARVLIYTISGRLVQTLTAPIVSNSNLSQEIVWDGLDAHGERLGRGVYIYRLEVRNPATGESAQVMEKLVLLR
ncbi:MAG: type IX secretion system sortase PorU [Bacteroidia bacterium]|nr:type IX secretion system sortase PorU [Bacteroidia bacterium]MCX7764335.1 type IX secretion system sortase PorU [Bacteroidia bacterium]MDW8056949.1 type IX secretion system sortase PorU [Bacteroidia bacterium]